MRVAAQKIVNVFLERGLGAFPVEATLSKAGSSSEQKNSRREDCNCQGGQQHLIRQNVVWEKEMLIILPSAVFFSADSPSRS